MEKNPRDPRRLLPLPHGQSPPSPMECLPGEEERRRDPLTAWEDKWSEGPVWAGRP